MKKNILIINGKKNFGHSNGGLNQRLVDEAEKFFKQKQNDVIVSLADSNYNIEEEVEKYLWANVILYQFPVWWMGIPWSLKKYIDEVFTSGHNKLYKNDGRSTTDKSKKYGSGGMLQNKQYMISATWNAPFEALENKDEFFEGVGNDGVFLPLHKANQFLGISPLPSFACYNVMKDPKIEEYIKEFIKYLDKI